MASTAATGTPRKARRWILIGVLTAGLLLALSAVWLGWRVWTVTSELESLLPVAAQARAAIEVGDRAQLAEVAEEIVFGRGARLCGSGRSDLAARRDGSRRGRKSGRRPRRSR